MRIITRVIISALVTISFTPQAGAQTGSDDVLRSLLSEVRALRLTMQKSNLLGLRGDLLVQRIRTAQGRETSTQNKVDSIRRQIANLEQETRRFKTRKEDLEEQIRREYDPDLVESLKQQSTQYDDALEMFEQQVASLRRDEAELLSRLDDDRARLEDLESAFDELLQEIEKALDTEP